jgi:chromosome segregation ATPase
MGESKTAKASKVVEKFEKKVIPDAELIRLLRIDRASGLYPTTQGTDALLRAFDAERATVTRLADSTSALLKRAEEAEMIVEELRTRIAELETELEETKSALATAEAELENIKSGPSA